MKIFKYYGFATLAFKNVCKIIVDIGLLISDSYFYHFCL